MRKSILIGVLAALMLFAFVACDNGTPVNPYNQVAGVGVRTTGDSVYLEGEDFDFRGVELVLYMTDGSEVTADTADFAVATAGKAMANTVKSVEVKYLGLDTYKATVPVEVEAITSLSVSTSVATAYKGIKGDTGETNVTKALDSEDFTVVASSDNELTRTLDPKEYTVTYDATSDAAAEQYVTVTYKANDSVKATSKETGSVQIDVVADKVVDFEVKAKDQHVYVTGSSTALASNFDVYQIWASADGVAETTAWTGVLSAPSAAGLQWNTADVPETDFSEEGAGSWYIELTLGADETVTHRATLNVENAYKEVKEAKLSNQPSSLLGKEITSSMFTVTASTLTNETATPVPSGNIYLSTDNGSTWTQSIYVSKFSDEEKIDVTIGVCLNDDTENKMISYQTSTIEVKIPENQPKTE